MTKPLQAPGCYGSALTFKKESPECRNCPYAIECQPLSEASLANIRQRLGIPTPAVRKTLPRKIEDVTLNKSTLTTFLPRKVEELMDRISAKGIRINEAFDQNRNPFTDTPAFMKVVCHMLLRSKQGIDQAMLRMALVKTLKWSEGTAHAHALQARHLLIAVGAAHEIDGRLFLRRTP